MRAWTGRITLALTLAAAAATSAMAEDTASGPTPALSAARAAVKNLADGLQAQLGAAIQSGGLVSAVTACHTIAPAVTDEASSTSALTVRRTALKVRNPANAPDAFERRVLERFQREMRAGSDPASLEHAETVTEGGRAVFRYMKAIPTAATPCLGCHGSNVQPEVKAEILRLYPNDEATGFSAGDLRGAFSVYKPL